MLHWLPIGAPSCVGSDLGVCCCSEGTSRLLLVLRCNIERMRHRPGNGIAMRLRYRICMYDVIAYSVAKTPCRLANPGSIAHQAEYRPAQIFANFDPEFAFIVACQRHLGREPCIRCIGTIGRSSIGRPEPSKP